MKIPLPARPRSLFGRLMLAFGTVLLAVLLLSMLILGDFVESAFKQQLADVMLQDALASARLHSVIAQFRLLLATVILSAGTMGLFGAYVLSRALARPIEAMSRFADDMGQSVYTGQMPTAEVAEFDQLASSLGRAATQLQSVFADLTEEKKRIAALIEDMAEGVVAVDERRRVLLVNPAAGELLGLPGPFDDLEIDQAGLPDPLVAGLASVLGDGPDEAVVSFPCAGAELQARVSRVLGEAGEAFGAVAVLQDVTTETQLRRLRENFVANVSHELRGPLAALSAGVEAMHDGLIGDETRPRYLRAMLSEIGRLRRLVDNLLELSRLDAGMLEIAQEEFDLQPLCEELRDVWAPRAQAAGIALNVDCPGLRVVANYDRVEEILSNFLDNAVRFTEPGGSIRLMAEPSGEMVRVGVADTGVGIARVHLPHIWDRFYKVDPARTRTVSGGTGLGLSIVRQLAHRMGGDVAVESEPGKGSTFSVTLVAARPQR